MPTLAFSRDLANLLLTVSSLVIAVIALHYTFQGYILKLGASLRGTFSIRLPGAYNDDAYVSDIALENLKERPIVIFKIYLRVGRNNYILIEDRAEEPLLLQPFGTYIARYDPIDQYGFLFARIKLNKLLLSRKARKRLVLVTTQSRYTIKAQMITSSIEHDVCNTDFTLVAHPMRITYKGRAYGSNVLYLVDYEKDNGQEEVVPIYPNDQIFLKFPGFFLTAQSLESKETLEDFLKERIDGGAFACRKLKIIDMRERQQWRYKPEDGMIHEAFNMGWLRYLAHEVVLRRLYNAFRHVKAIRSNSSYERQLLDGE